MRITGCLLLSVYTAMVVLGLGCASGGAGKSASVSPRSALIEDVDPFSLGDEFAFIYKTETPTKQPEPAQKPVQEIPETTQAPAEETPAQPVPQYRPGLTATSPVETMGFRIHVAMFSKEAEAQDFAKKIESKIEEKVYVVYEPPFFRVRVGDFTELQKAEDYVRYLKDLGYKRSWWIRTTIYTQ